MMLHFYIIGEVFVGVTWSYPLQFYLIGVNYYYRSILYKT